MLEDTGERVIPERMKITNGLLLEHIARYHFAARYANGRILDFACGSGYGSQIIAKQCKNNITELIGIDYEEEAIKYAKQKYYHPLATFIQGDVLDTSLSDRLGHFDVILSFETIEHINKEERFLSNIYRLLKPNGILLLSTPFGEGRGIPSGQEFHVHQLTEEEFRSLFNEYTSKKFYYQKGVLIEPAENAEEEHYPLGIAVCKK
ncbi:class I SAM-dependent methyltransferase [Oceanobacillus halophilus]|uniref:Class I SAM-dependent methyltransferase n=1 Tax=Oceanobacillus halophilus TaxID=930130 RepID=A0A494ZVF4_9BACI|nr:class I SAM-dependent methyltransferase [Oceanobacillus halophilus]RKQ30512.1 class I SAM-dependent methyltransferase [Oceanobacillus halophilus]